MRTYAREMFVWMQVIILMDSFETILTDRKAKLLTKPSQYNGVHSRNLPRAAVRQQSCPKTETVQVLLGKNVGREGPRSHQNSCHRIRVSRGRLPQDFFGNIDLQRINTVDANLNYKNDYASIDTPTFASRAEKLKQKSRIEFGDEPLPISKDTQEAMYAPIAPKRMRSFFNTESESRLLSHEQDDNKNVGVTGVIKLADYRMHDKQANTVDVQKYAETLSTAYNSKLYQDQTSDTTSIAATKQAKHQSAPQCQKNKPRKDSLKSRFRNFFLNETLELQSHLLNKEGSQFESFPQKRKRMRQIGLREELFDIPILRFPQSEKNLQFNHFPPAKPSILPPLHQK